MDAALHEHRTTKDRFLATDERSPIADRSSFTGLSYYPSDPDLVFAVTPDPVEPEPIAVGTTTGEERTYMKVATADLSIAGRDVTLTLYDTGHHGYFLPFRDATSGVETYGAGRYLDLHDNEDGTVTIDFNYAYAPFCAYNARLLVRPAAAGQLARRADPRRGAHHRNVIDVLLPSTDGGVAVQLVLLVVFAGAGVYLTRRSRDLRILVVGVAVLILGLMAVRAIH